MPGGNSYGKAGIPNEMEIVSGFQILAYRDTPNPLATADKRV